MMNLIARIVRVVAESGANETSWAASYQPITPACLREPEENIAE